MPARRACAAKTPFGVSPTRWMPVGVTGLEQGRDRGPAGRPLVRHHRRQWPAARDRVHHHQRLIAQHLGHGGLPGVHRAVDEAVDAPVEHRLDELLLDLGVALGLARRTAGADAPARWPGSHGSRRRRRTPTRSHPRSVRWSGTCWSAGSWPAGSAGSSVPAPPAAPAPGRPARSACPGGRSTRRTRSSGTRRPARRRPAVSPAARSPDLLAASRSGLPTSRQASLATYPHSPSDGSTGGRRRALTRSQQITGPAGSRSPRSPARGSAPGPAGDSSARAAGGPRWRCRGRET